MGNETEELGQRLKGGAAGFVRCRKCDGGIDHKQKEVLRRSEDSGTPKDTCIRITTTASYDVMGRLPKTLIEGKLPAWDSSPPVVDQ